MIANSRDVHRLIIAWNADSDRPTHRTPGLYGQHNRARGTTALPYPTALSTLPPAVTGLAAISTTQTVQAFGPRLTQL